MLGTFVAHQTNFLFMCFPYLHLLWKQNKNEKKRKNPQKEMPRCLYYFFTLQLFLYFKLITVQKYRVLKRPLVIRWVQSVCELT